MTARSFHVVVALALSAVVLAERQPPSCDLLIAGGRVVDGTGAPWFAADVCVYGDRIAAIRPGESARSTRRIDAAGLIVAPGFIDMLGQSEYWVLRDSRVASKIMQGITTELTGEASFTSVGHPNARRLHPFAAMFDAEKVPGFDNLAGYLRVLDRQPATINLGTFVSAGGVRESVVGREDRAATDAELKEMEAQVSEAMQAGAFGVSTSLQYVPDRFATTEEIVALAKVARRYGGSYITHQRSESYEIDASLDEVFRIAREADIPAQVYHLKTSGKPNWGRMPAVLKRLEQARAMGLDVSADQYPYIAGQNSLDANLPLWVRDGGRDKMIERLKDPALRARVKADVVREDRSWENQYLGSGGPGGVLIVSVVNPALKKYEGRTLEQIAKDESKDPVDVIMDIVIADRANTSNVIFMMSEDDVRLALKHPLVSLCTDSGAKAMDGIFSLERSHPRAWGSAARILGRYVREEKLLPLEEAVRKMTSLPASRMGLAERGIVRPGMLADLVAFDPETVKDKATFEDPLQYSEGIPFVAVNGQLVVDSGQITTARPGRALLGPGYRSR